MFSERQLGTLRALVDRIIPPDDFPGGWEAGVGAYLERQLARDLRPWIAIYHAGLAALDAESIAAAGLPFTALDPAAQDTLLARIEHGDVVTDWPVDPAMFFRGAVAQAAEGYYSDPGNGGNHDEVAWRMIGFEAQR